MNRTCSICNDPQRGPVINSFLAAGRSPNWIEREMKRTNRNTKAETVRRHRDNCLGGDAEAGVINEAIASGGAGMAADDFAVAVRKRAGDLLKEGKLNVRTEHGLQAQALIDRRHEKAADRNLQIELARLMSGGLPAAAIPDDLIEGEWHEVEQPAPLALVSNE